MPNADDTADLSPNTLAIDGEAILKIATSLGIRIPERVNAQTLNTTMKGIADVAAAIKAQQSAPAGHSKWIVIVVVVLQSLTAVLGSYNASKPSPATPADVQAAVLKPEQITEAVWNP